ncbi:MAG: FAD:protein FMN transferase, partial [Acidimicrobiia bacterium]
ALSAGGLATSAITKRRWPYGPATAHHVIDPTTGRPATDSAAAVTVIAPRAVDAETLATAALLSGPDQGIELLIAHGASGVVIGRDGTRRATMTLLELVA